jgi:hypothetical protein
MAGPTPQIVLRTSTTMYVLLGGIVASVNLFSGFVAATKDPSLWTPTAIGALMFAALMTWMGTTSLVLTNDHIRYRSLFVTKEYPLRNVVKANFAIGFVPLSYKPFQRVVLTVRDGNSKHDVTINAGLFDREKTRHLIDALNTRLT